MRVVDWGRHGWATAGLICVAVVVTTGPTLSQPSQSQINAVRQNCRSDYMSHCSSVPPGGAESLNCLQNNAARLSSSCRSAVDALKPAATPAPKPAAAPPSQPAPKPAAAPAPAREPEMTAPAKPPPPKQTAKPPPSRTAPPPRTAAVPPAAPAQPAWVYVPMPPLLPRVQLAIIRACDGDRQAVCSMVSLGGGRVIECLARNEPALSPFCRQTLTSARASAGR